jgi:arylsulfatase A-like enzyme
VAEPRLTRFIASHAGPHDHDRRVPVMFWSPKVEAEVRAEPVAPLDIAPSLAHIMGVKAPSDLDGICLTIADFGAGPCPAAVK